MVRTHTEEISGSIYDARTKRHDDETDRTVYVTETLGVLSNNHVGLWATFLGNHSYSAHAADEADDGDPR